MTEDKGNERPGKSTLQATNIPVQDLPEDLKAKLLGPNGKLPPGMVSRLEVSSRSAPLPPSDEIDMLEKYHRGAAKELIGHLGKRLESEAYDLETKRMAVQGTLQNVELKENNAAKSEKRGQWMAPIIAILDLALLAYALHEHVPTIVDLGLIGVFAGDIGWAIYSNRAPREQKPTEQEAGQKD